MKCSVPRCEEFATTPPLRVRSEFAPPFLELCSAHRARYTKDYRRHFAPMFKQLAVKTRHPVARARAAEVVQAWATNGTARTKSWVATWVQMVDLELLNDPSVKKVLGAQKVKLSESGEWVPDDGAKPSSFPAYAKKKEGPLPEGATRAGQAAIAKRAAEEEALTKKLHADTVEFARGQRQLLEFELKGRRIAEELAVKKRAKKTT